MYGSVVPWCCPHCRGGLRFDVQGAECVACRRRYERVGPILDLRIASPNYDCETDTQRATRLWEGFGSSGAEQFVREMFSERPGWDAKRIEYRTRQVVQGPLRYRKELDGWLAPAVGGAPPFLDLGCGGGNLLAAAALEGRAGIGIDLSITLLMVAHLLIGEHGGKPVLAAGLGEALPLRDGSVSGVVSLDVIEHVPDVPAYLREISRVTRKGGHVAFSTPNRYSLAPEPHVGLLGVGWLPRRWQQPYVRWRIGDPYKSVSLMSVGDLRNAFEQHTSIDLHVEVAPIPEDEMRYFGRAKAALARAYNRLNRRRLGQSIFRCCGAFFWLTGERQ